MTWLRHTLSTSLVTTAGVLLVTVAVWSTSVSADDAESVHRRAWSENLDSALTNPAARFGFYAYRSLAVQHPEVYLQADRLVSEVLENLPGTRLAYRTTNVRDPLFYLRIARRETQGGAFGWGQMSMTPDSVYDVKPSRADFHWLNLRAPSVAVLLKSTTPHLSTLESSILRYTQMAETRIDHSDLFIIVDRGGAGYVAWDTAAWVGGLTTRAVRNLRDISPVLVFNRQSVYSAITGRDDRGVSPQLARLMERLGTPGRVSFDGGEKELAVRLAQATALDDSTMVCLAVLVASGLTDQQQPQVDSAWADVLRDHPETLPCASLLLEEALFWANRLSPATAQLAAILASKDFAESVQLVQSEYLARAGRRINENVPADTAIEAWGCLFSYDLVQILIDDNFRTRAGSSLSQASAMSAVLDLAGIEHFQLAVRLGDAQIPTQEWIFTDDGRHQCNFGVWTIVPDVLPTSVRPQSILVAGFTVRGVPVRLRENTLCSRLDEVAVAGRLTRIAGKLPLAKLVVTALGGEVRSIQQFVMELTDNRHQAVETPWPARTAH